MDKNQQRKDERKDQRDVFLLFLYFGLIFTFGGTVYQFYGITKVGYNLKTLQPTVLNSAFLFFFAVVCFVCSYYAYKTYKRMK